MSRLLATSTIIVLGEAFSLQRCSLKAFNISFCVCQTRLTADKSMRLLLSTFSSLREELLHMSEDLRVKAVAAEMFFLDETSLTVKCFRKCVGT